MDHNLCQRLLVLVNVVVCYHPFGYYDDAGGRMLLSLRHQHPTLQPQTQESDSRCNTKVLPTYASSASCSCRVHERLQENILMLAWFNSHFTRYNNRWSLRCNNSIEMFVPWNRSAVRKWYRIGDHGQKYPISIQYRKTIYISISILQHIILRILKRKGKVQIDQLLPNFVVNITTSGQLQYEYALVLYQLYTYMGTQPSKHLEFFQLGSFQKTSRANRREKSYWKYCVTAPHDLHRKSKKVTHVWHKSNTAIAEWYHYHETVNTRRTVL